mgnify:CR=1 FL=1
MTSSLDEPQQVMLKKRHTCFIEWKIVPNEKSAKILSQGSLFHSATRQYTPDYVIANLDRPIFLAWHAPNIFDFRIWFLLVGIRNVDLLCSRVTDAYPALINKGNLIRKVSCRFEYSSSLHRFFSNLVQLLLVPAVFLPTMLTLFWLFRSTIDFLVCYRCCGY